MPVDLYSIVQIALKKDVIKKELEREDKRYLQNHRHDVHTERIRNINKPFQKILEESFIKVGIPKQFSNEFWLYYPTPRSYSDLNDYFIMEYGKTYWVSADSEGKCPPEDPQDILFNFFERIFANSLKPIELLGNDLLLVMCRLDGG